MATKKIKKVETPIDQRETFVSLQKNFADSEISVEEKLKTLYALQEADSAIDKIIQMRGELPSEVEALENEIADLKARQAQDAAVIEAYNQTIAENRQNIVDCDTQIEKYQQQLNDISNSREYDSINKEVENQGLLRQIAQKNINDTKAAILEKKEDIESLKDYIAVRTDESISSRIKAGCLLGGSHIAPDRTVALAVERHIIPAENGVFRLIEAAPCEIVALRLVRIIQLGLCIGNNLQDARFIGIICERDAPYLVFTLVRHENADSTLYIII